MKLISLLLVCLGGLTGCATHSIWDSPLLDNFHEPARPSRLAIYEVPGKKDYLVQYYDLSPTRDTLVPKAYYLEENRTRIEQARKPHFVSLKEVGKGVPIPVLESTNRVEHSYAQTPIYVVQESHERFRIYGQGAKLIAESDLPTYPTGAGTVKRLILTPITLTLDATVIGGYAFYYFAPEILGAVAAAR